MTLSDEINEATDSKARAGIKARALADVIGLEWSSSAKLEIPRSVRGQGWRILFDAPPALIRDRFGNVVGVDAMVRVMRGNTELEVDPHRICVNPPVAIRRPNGTVEIDPREAYLDWLIESLHNVPNRAGWRTRGTVTTVYTDTADGWLQSANATYLTARSGGTMTQSTGGTEVRAGQRERAAATSYDIFEGFIHFDTSSIPDTDVISAADLSLYGKSNSSTVDFILQARLQDWGGTLTTADWIAGASLSALPLLGTLDTVGFTTVDYNILTSDANLLTNINKTGFTRMILCSDRTVAANVPSTDTNEFVDFHSAEAAGTTQDAKLEVTHGSALTLVPRAWQQYRQRRVV